MNKNSFSVSLPWGEVIRRSYGYLFGHLDLLVKVAAVWFLAVLGFEALTAFPSLCSLDSGICGIGKQTLSLLVLTVSSIAVIIGYVRCIVLRIIPEGYASLSFGKRELRYIGKVFVIGFITALPIFLLSFVIGFVGSFLQVNPRIFVPFIWLGMFVCLFFSFRLYLVLPAVAVDDLQTADLKKSFEITKGNTNKIFWGFVVTMLPGWIAFMILGVIFRAAPDVYVIKIIFAALTLIVSFIDVGLKASYFAHLYQYFIYYYRKWQQEESK